MKSKSNEIYQSTKCDVMRDLSDSPVVKRKACRISSWKKTANECFKRKYYFTWIFLLVIDRDPTHKFKIFFYWNFFVFMKCSCISIIFCITQPLKSYTFDIMFPIKYSKRNSNVCNEVFEKITQHDFDSTLLIYTLNLMKN